MRGEKVQRLRKPGGSARVSMLTFLRANFQVATREQRLGWFQTADPQAFERRLAKLYVQSHHDHAARHELDEMVAQVRAHVLRLIRETELPEVTNDEEREKDAPRTQDR